MGNLYVVIEPEDIVAQDLSFSINAFDPHARVLVFRHPDQAIEAIHSSSPSAVIANAPPADFLSSPLGRMLIERSIPFAFSRVLAESEAAGTPILSSPFSETSVAALLRTLLNR